MKKILAAAIMLLMSLAYAAQVAAGPVPFGSFGGGPFGSVNLSDLNVNFVVPVVDKAGRGIPFAYALSYNSSVLFPSTSGGIRTWQPVQNYGWQAQTDAAYGYMRFHTAMCQCRVFNDDGTWDWWLWTLNVFDG